MPITLLQINVDANNGSNGAIARNIGTLVMRNGGKSYIAYGRNVVPGDSEQFRIGSSLDVIEHGFESRLFDNHGLASRRVTRNLINKIKEIQPDIIHLHNIHGYFVNYKILFEYLNQTNIPVVWTLHDCWPFTGHCAHFEWAQCDKWKTGCYFCPLRGKYPKSLMIDASKRNYELKKSLFASNREITIVPVSDWLCDLVKQSFLKDTNVRVIHNGIDLNVFRPMQISKKDLGLDERKRTVLGVSNVWTNGKGLNEFIKLSEDNTLQVVLIGVDDKVRRLLPDNIVAVSRTQNQQQLAEYYTVADVFVNPTYADTFPTVNLEALACGTPVITYRTGGSPESVDENTGAVVKRGDYDALYNTVRLMLNDNQNVKSIRHICRKRAEEKFNKDTNFTKYIELYDKILSK